MKELVPNNQRKHSLSRFSYLIIWCTVFIFSSCQENREIKWGIYHWKSSFSLDSNEINFVHEASIKTIYLRYFDVNKKGSDLIVSGVMNQVKKIDQIKYVPCVYLVNNSLKELEPENTVLLAQRIIKQINFLNSKFDLSPSEILIDCDWTKSTQAPYFLLLKEIKKQSDYKITSTVRLHQFKNHKQTGVPPADRGQLMMYNMGDLTNLNEKNSIINPQIARQYQKNFNEYPIKLDVSIPIFSWLVLYRRNRSIELINDFNPQLLNDTSIFNQREDQLFRLKLDTFIFSKFRYKNDLFRMESSKNEDLAKMIDDWKESFNSDSLEIILYDLRPQNINNRLDAIESVESILR